MAGDGVAQADVRPGDEEGEGVRKLLLRQRWGLGVMLACVAAVACGGGSSSSTSGDGGTGGSGAQGSACTCPGETDASGDTLCAGHMYTSCGAYLYCIDGVCTTTCNLDGGTCPSGFVCKLAPHSGLVYCAPQ